MCVYLIIFGFTRDTEVGNKKKYSSAIHKWVVRFKITNKLFRYFNNKRTDISCVCNENWLESPNNGTERTTIGKKQQRDYNYI